MAGADALVKAFTAANPGITVKTETRPAGAEGDNLIKTRLATGEMTDVFVYNNGSLLQAIKPEQNLLPLDDQPWVGEIDELFAESSKGSDGKIYGGPWERPSAAGCSTTCRSTRSSAWRSPRPGTSSWRTTRRSRLPEVDPVDADLRGRPGPPSCSCWVTSTTSPRPSPTSPRSTPPTRPSTRPRRRRSKGSSTSRRSHDAGYLNKDFASAKLNDGIEGGGHRDRAHYPQLGGSRRTSRTSPGQGEGRRLLRPARR